MQSPSSYLLNWLSLALVSLFFGLQMTACGTDGYVEEDPRTSCQPGDSGACTCDDGALGERMCRSDGSFSSCQCPDDDQPPQPNACGGQGDLTFEGAPAKPDDPCGPCNDGLLACDGQDLLTCQGPGEPNSCGGCALLPAEPDQECVEAGEPGIWECTGPDSIFCNPCTDEEQRISLGGQEVCAQICDNDGQCAADEVCHETQDVCIADEQEPDENACGGLQPLNHEPTTPCAEGDGQWQCAGDNDVLCECTADEAVYDAATDSCGLTDEAICDIYCDITVGCLNECGLSIINTNALVDGCLNGFDPGDQGCNDLVASDPFYEAFIYTDFTSDDPDARRAQPNTCADTKWLRCGGYGVWSQCTPACAAPTTIGDSCTADDQCDPGDLHWGDCIGEQDAQGDLVGDGICYAGTCYTPEGLIAGDINSDGGCGAGNGCRVFQGDGGTLNACVPLCADNSQCDPGQACQLAGELYDADGFTDSPAPIGIARHCMDACTNDSDCGADARCNPVGICEFSCDLLGGQALCDELGGTCVDVAGTDYCELS